MRRDKRKEGFKSMSEMNVTKSPKSYGALWFAI